MSSFRYRDTVTGTADTSGNVTLHFPAIPFGKYVNVLQLVVDATPASDLTRLEVRINGQLFATITPGAGSISGISLLPGVIVELVFTALTPSSSIQVQLWGDADEQPMQPIGNVAIAGIFGGALPTPTAIVPASIVQVKGNTISSGNTITTTFTNPTQVGSAILALVTLDDVISPGINLPTTNSLTPFAIVPSTFKQNLYTFAAYLRPPASSQQAVTVTKPGPSNPAMNLTIIELAGSDLTVATADSAISTGNSWAPGSISPVTESLIIAYMGYANISDPVAVPPDYDLELQANGVNLYSKDQYAIATEAPTKSGLTAQNRSGIILAMN